MRLQGFRLATLGAGAVMTLAIAASGAQAATVETVTDGGFEATTCGANKESCQNPNWPEVGTQAAVCLIIFCTPTASGAGQLQLGNESFTFSATGSVAQAVNLQGAPNTLRFQLLRVPSVAASGTFTVSIDGTPILTRPEASEPHTSVTASLPAVSPGAHTLSFSVVCAGPMGQAVCPGFFVDDISLTTVAPDVTPPPVAPHTTLTSRPKAKTNKKQAKFGFTSTIADSTFECSLDGGAYAGCLSPRTVKVSKGKHDFRVRAVAAGVVDPTPASFNWTVKKKKKRK